MRVIGLGLVVALGCGSAPPPAPAPREMRASEHRDAATLHAARAAELARLSDALGGGQREKLDDPATGLWFRSLEEERQAHEHLVEAAALHTEFEERCGALAPAQIVVSPLQRSSIGWLRKPDGIVVLLATEAGPPERLLQELRCHRAWMRLGEAAEDKCPLELPGIDLVAYGDRTGISVEITLSDPALVAELQRRTEHVIATKQHPH